MRLFRAAVALSLCLGGSVAAPQSIFDFDDWMQRIDKGNPDLQRQIAARDAATATRSARELDELYGLLATFFAKRAEAAEAVRWSREGREWAARAQADLAAQQFSAARRQALAIAHGCRKCHVRYKPL